MRFLNHLRKNPSSPSSEGKRIYLDYAAATPLRSEVWTVMEPLLKGVYGNPSAIHQEGIVARRQIEEARARLGKALEVPREGIVFTGNGTESTNLALGGHVEHLNSTGLAYEDMEIISTRIEHPATVKTLENLRKRGVTIVYLPVSEEGRINLEDLRRAISPRTVLVTVAYVNSEIGTIERVSALGKVIAAERKIAPYLLFHLDAAQAPLWLPCVVPHLGVDMLSLDAGKCGGPKGVGILVCRKGVVLEPLLGGGPQEQGLRPGTESVALIVGAVEAVLLAQRERAEVSARVAKLRDHALTLLQAEIPEAIINGPLGDARVANNINVSLPGLDPEFTVVTLDVGGVAASTKSACGAAGGGKSVVVYEVTKDVGRAESTLRLTLGPTTTQTELETAVTLIKRHWEKEKSRT